MSLAGSRGGAPCRVWGDAPTVARATNSKEVANKGAGSEAVQIPHIVIVGKSVMI